MNGIVQQRINNDRIQLDDLHKRIQNQKKTSSKLIQKYLDVDSNITDQEMKLLGRIIEQILEIEHSYNIKSGYFTHAPNYENVRYNYYIRTKRDKIFSILEQLKEKSHTPTFTDLNQAKSLIESGKFDKFITSSQKKKLINFITQTDETIILLRDFQKEIVKI